MPLKRRYSQRSYGGRVVKRRSSGRSWSGPFGSYRKAAMGSFMRNLWQTYPRKPTEEMVSGREQVGPVTISGVGDYTFSKKGNHSIGARIGAWLGDSAQSVLGKITGLGDYSVMKNSLVNDPPSVRNNSARTVTLSHREYIGDVVTGAAGSFDLKAYKIQPGDPTTFPWLSTIASQFQQYTLDGVIFQFKSMSADALNSTNTALGQVIMATNYNVSAPLFDSKYEMENTEFSSSVKPSCSAMHPIECARRESTLNELYVAPGGVVPGGKDPSFYDFGNFQIATNGFQASNVNIGELWVTYEITLLKPILNSINNTQVLWDCQYRRPRYTLTTPLSLAPALPWWSRSEDDFPQPVATAGNKLVLEFSGDGGNTVTIKKINDDLPFPVGTMFYISISADATAAGKDAVAIGDLSFAAIPGSLAAVPNVANPTLGASPLVYSLRSAATIVGETHAAAFITLSTSVLPAFTITSGLLFSNGGGENLYPDILLNVFQIREDAHDENF